MTSGENPETEQTIPRETAGVVTSNVAANSAASPRYAVIVASYNRGSRILPLVESLLRSEVEDFELVIIDHSPNDETRSALEPFLGDRRIRYVHSEIPGTSRARNRGLQLTTAPLIAITDDDCIVPPDWLSSLMAPFDRHPRIGIVYCNVEPVPVEGEGHTPHIRFAETRLVRYVSDIRLAQPLWMGAGMAIRRSILADVVGFDELLGPGCAFSACEDNDIAWRSLARGWWVCENADSTVVHDGFRSLEQLRAHGMRDFYGMGGTFAKYARIGHLRIAGMAIPLLYRSALALPLTDLLNGRAPRGLRRPYMLLRGFVDGLRAPLDHESGMYRQPPA